METRLLFYTEVSKNLSFNFFSVVEIMQKLAKEQGCTILLVTHDNRILDIADYIVYLEDGRLVNKPQ
jgi:ABC-type lipoprotein export system ATPase subunit